jgi:hypothetical protein
MQLGRIKLVTGSTSMVMASSVEPRNRESVGVWHPVTPAVILVLSLVVSVYSEFEAGVWMSTGTIAGYSLSGST